MEYRGREYREHRRDAVGLRSKRQFRWKGDSEENYLLSKLQQVERKHEEYIHKKVIRKHEEYIHKKVERKHEHFRHTQSNKQFLDREQFRFLEAFKKSDQTAWRGLLEKGFTADPDTLKEVLKITDDAVTGTVKQYLNELCIKIKEVGSSITHVWAAWKAGNPNDVVFVVEHKDNDDPKRIRVELYKKFPSLRFEIRVPSEVNSEARNVIDHRGCELKPLTEHDHDQLKKCIVKHSARLLKEHSNIQIISPCSVRSKRFGTKYWHIEYETCIVLYVHYKGIIPFGESLFPTELDGIPVDVREGEFKLHSNPYLRMGCQIRAMGEQKYGTLGGFVDLENETIGALTCAHVLLKDDEISNYADPNGYSRYTGADHRQVSQPDSSNRDHVFGTLEKIVLTPGNEYSAGVDAALVKITATDRYPTGEFDCTEDNHGPGNNRFTFCSGNIITDLSNIYANEIIKCGFRTGMTKGRLHSDYSLISPQNSEGPIFQTMYKQIEIKKRNNRSQNFSDKGDSGALVMVDNKDNRNDLKAIGLLIGGTSYHTTIASPIGDVLKNLNIRGNKLKTFPMEEEDRSADVGSNHTSNILSRTADLPSSLLRPTLEAIQRDISEIKKDIRFMKSDIATINYYLVGSRR